MKRLALTAAATALCCVSLAAAPFYNPTERTRRNYLTDAQIQYLWANGANPRISPAIQRNWLYRAQRYDNFTNWLNGVGRTNNFAALATEFQGRALNAEGLTNSLAKLNRTLATNCEVFSNAVIIAQAQTADAETRAAAHSNRLAKITTFLTEKRDAAKLATTKAIYQAILDKLADAAE